MIIIHDFFQENGGGENLIISIAKKYNIKILSAYSKKKNVLIEESKFNFLLKKNKVFTFFYYYFFFRLVTNKNLIFSGNHCVYANNKCIAKKKILYAHSLPKYLYSELYIGTNTNFMFNLFKNYLKKKYEKNIILFDEIIFNSIKTKSKFMSAIPDLKNYKNNLKIIYPFSELKFLNDNVTNKPKKYLVINSRHTPSKNIIQTILNFLKIIKEQKMSIYVTHEGIITGDLKNKFSEYSDCISFTGYLQMHEYQKLLCESLAVIFPSIDEDFGISALDAYNLNIPVILHKNSGFSEVLDKDYDFYIDDNSPKEIIDKLKRYLNHNDFNYNNKIDLKVILFNYFNKYYE